jgi:hypothetical protein
MFTTLEHFGDEPVEVTYPHDLYFMDLDGTYILNESGIDQHLPGDGDVGPEIYVSRITAGNLSLTGKDEATLINEYFAKVHAYHTGQLTYLNRGIVFADDDWSSWGEEQMRGLYNNVWALNDPSETTRAGYLAALAENYESILECIHSWPQGHAIQVGDTYEYLYNTDILQANPRPAFYNMFNCSSARFTENNHLIGTYVYGGDYGLNAIGSTKTGGMLFFDDFYVPQGHGASLGEAFRDWFDKWAAPTDNPAQNWMVDWFYGMTMQGAPTLRPKLMGDPSMTHRVTVLPGATVQDVDFGNRQLSADTTTVVTSSANPAVYGDAVFFTATVSSDSGTPTGTVQFVVNGTNLGAPVALSGGTAQSIAVSNLNAATHTVVAQYQPDGGFDPSSGQLAGGQQIDQRPITVTAVTDTKVYDGTTDSTGTPTITSGSAGRRRYGDVDADVRHQARRDGQDAEPGRDGQRRQRRQQLRRDLRAGWHGQHRAGGIDRDRHYRSRQTVRRHGDSDLDVSQATLVGVISGDECRWTPPARPESSTRIDMTIVSRADAANYSLTSRRQRRPVETLPGSADGCTSGSRSGSRSGSARRTRRRWGSPRPK